MHCIYTRGALKCITVKVFILLFRLAKFHFNFRLPSSIFHFNFYFHLQFFMEENSFSGEKIRKDVIVQVIGYFLIRQYVGRTIDTLSIH